MKGYPKHINNKHDLEVAYKLDPERTKKLIQGWQRWREGWYTVKKIETADGVEDKTHRVKTVEPEKDSGGEAEFYQEEYGAIPGNKIDRLGLTEKELQSLVQQG